MSIELVRIDDRLIHGQVVMAWHHNYPVERMVIVDDKIANDSIRKMLLETVAPPGVRVSVLSQKKGEEALLENAYGEERLMILATTPNTIVGLVKCGVLLTTINVGGMGYGPSKRRLTPTIAIDALEQAAFEELHRLGIRVQIQMIPSDRPVDMNGLLKR